MPAHTNNFPKLHNAAWPGVVGKGSPGAEPFIELDKMLDMTAAAEVDGVRFDGVDLFLFEPHIEHRRLGRRPEETRRQGDEAEPEDRLDRRAGLGRHERRLGLRARKRTEAVRRAGEEGLPHRHEAPRVGRAAIRHRADRHGRRARRLAERSRRQPASGGRHVPQGGCGRGRSRRAARRRRRNLLGRHDGVELPIFDFNAGTSKMAATRRSRPGADGRHDLPRVTRTRSRRRSRAPAASGTTSPHVICRHRCAHLVGPIHSARPFTGQGPTDDEWKWGKHGRVARHAEKQVLVVEYLNRFECY